MIKKRISKDKNNCQKYKNSNKSRKYWTNEEDNILKSTVQLHGSDWKLIAEYLNGRNASQCAQRWKRVKPDNEEKNQKWTPEEDEEVKRLTKLYKFDWKVIARFLSNRTGRQIRERYINHLDPNINNKAWSQQEDLKIWTLFKKIGSRWSEMAKKLKGRPENMIKNRFYGYRVEKQQYYVEIILFLQEIEQNIIKQTVSEKIMPNKKILTIQYQTKKESLLKRKIKLKFQIIKILLRLELKILSHKSWNKFNKINSYNNKKNNLNQAFILYCNHYNQKNITSACQAIIRISNNQNCFIKCLLNHQRMSFQKLIIILLTFCQMKAIQFYANSHNQFTYTPQKEEENDNFLNQFLQVDGSSVPVAMRADIFEEYTKFSQMEH